MDALVWTPDGLELRRDVLRPAAPAGEALIRVRVAGICATDIELTRGYKGGFAGILGHEFVGEVVEAPSAPEWIGQRVVGEINIGCGVCELCVRGLGKHCRQRSALGIRRRDGVFAEYVALPIANLHAVPPTVSDEQAVFVEPLAAAFQILAQVPAPSHAHVIVLGDGRLGLLCAMALATTGCDLTVVGRNPAKLAILQRMGLEKTVVNTPASLDELARRPADVVVDATGVPEGFETSLRLTRPAGVLVMKSTYAGRLREFDMSRLVVDEITLVGSRCGPFAVALAALEAGAVDVLPLIHARYSLRDGIAAFEHAGQKGVLKVLIEP